MARLLLLMSVLWVATDAASAQSPEARAILERYHALRPTAQDLAMYRLDWAASLKQALERGNKEKRPILLVIIHAQYGDLTSGHC